jgi:hypothetical protein
MHGIAKFGFDGGAGLLDISQVLRIAEPCIDLFGFDPSIRATGNTSPFVSMATKPRRSPLQRK